MTEVDPEKARFDEIIRLLDGALAGLGEVVADAPERGNPLCTQAQNYAYVLPDHISMWRNKLVVDSDIMFATVNAETVKLVEKEEDTPQ